MVSGVRLIACSSAPGKIMLIKTEGRTHERTPKFQFHLEGKQKHIQAISRECIMIIIMLKTRITHMAWFIHYVLG